MKFTDGNWMMRDGVHPFYAAEAYEMDASQDRLTVVVPTRSINHRGDTLGGPLLTIAFSSPMPDVIGVEIKHYSGAKDRGPSFEIFAQKGFKPAVEISEEAATMTSGKLSIRIPRKGWEVDFRAGGRSITKSGGRGIGYMEVDGEGSYVHEQLSLGVGECVYGLGERFTSFVKNSQVVEIWNKDPGTGSDQAYKNIPFYLTNRGYGVFVDDPGNVSFEVASEKVSRVQFSVPGESLKYYVIYGPTPKEVLQKYTALTGRPALPPPWSFGLWLTTSFTTSYDEETVTSFIQGMADRDLPLHVFHFDCFWMRDYRWCDFQWDERTFPDPPAMLKRLKERGLHICVWINPYISQLSSLFQEGRAGGYLIKKPNGDVWQTDQWQPGMGIVDFTNPAACAWFQEKLSALMDMGVDCFKTDFGERIPTDVIYYDGSDPERMHNYYAYIYNKTVFDLLKERRGEGEAALFARSASVGSQQYPVHWGGDCYSNFESMAESLRGGLSLCLSGFGFWSHDIGGFEGLPPAAVYKRWIAFGLMSSHSRLHGSSSYRVPWVYDDEAVDVLRFFTKLKCRLMPYLYEAACEAANTGVPLMRAMILEFPDDPACDFIERQYFLGDSLMVAPVFSEGDVDFYVPAGRWTDFLSGKVYDGPVWVREKHSFLSMPLLVRPNSVIPVGSVDTRPDYDWAEGVTLHIYQIEEGKTVNVRIPDAKGGEAMTATVQREKDEIRVQASGSKPWHAQLVGIDSVSSVAGGTAESAEHVLLIRPNAGATSVNIKLAE
jgi:alpha-D-xyloside xylohydrolase